MTSLLAQQTEEIRPVTIAGEDGGLTPGQAIRLIRRILENYQEDLTVAFNAIHDIVDGTK